MTKLEAVKLVARIVVGAGTTTVTNSIIKNNVAPANIFQQVSVGVSSVVIGSMAAQATKEHTEQQIDALVAAWQHSKNKADTPTPA